MSAADLLLSFGSPLQAVAQSVTKARAFLHEQAATRTPYNSSALVPSDPTLDRHATGPWLGSYTMPPTTLPLFDTPVLVQGPVNFPLDPSQPADFLGKVDWPFVSMDGYVGNDGNPGDDYAQGGTRSGSFFIVGSAGGVKQFVTKVPANGVWSASVAVPPASGWSFQLVTYATQADHDADINRILIGHPWLEAERPGDVRQYYDAIYVSQPPQFIAVAIARGPTNVISGTVASFVLRAGKTYQILVTDEVDVEYAWALQPVVGPGSFTISRVLPLGSNVKLRLVEQQSGCTQRVVGPVWCSLNAAAASAWPDLQVEFRSIVDIVPFIPQVIQPAHLDLSWSFTLAPVSTPRVTLVSTNTKRIYGQFTMPSGLLRSFNVPANEFSQNIAGGVYYAEFNDACFLYDQGVALIACIQLGETELAQRLLQALIDCQHVDGSYVFGVDQAALQTVQDFVRIGAVAWVVYALLIAGAPQSVVTKTLNYMLTFQNALGLINGGRGNPGDPTFVVPWWSVEHNIDLWWVFDLADRLYGGWRSTADTIKTELLTDGVGWDAVDGIFWQGGTVTSGVNTPDGMHALDMHTWGGVLLNHWGYQDRLIFAMDRAYRLYYCTDPAYGWSGFTTFVPEDGYPPETVISPWYEGSYGAAIAVRQYDSLRATGLMRTLAYAQLPDGSYHYTLERDVEQGIETFPSLIGAAWNILAYSGQGTPYQSVLWT